MNRFFVIGSPRSGTTLFRLMLNKHKGLVVPPEAGFLTWLYGNYKDFNCGMIDDFVEDLSQTKKFASWNVDISALREYLVKAGPQNYKSLIDLVYAFYAQRVLKKNVTIMGDKNNFFLNEIVLLGVAMEENHFPMNGSRVAARIYLLLLKQQNQANFYCHFPNHNSTRNQ